MVRSVGIRDVADRAGVSTGTVSNVFNRPEAVATETRLRVEAAAASLRYVRNESARQLRMGHSRTIGLIVPDIANPFFTDIARGVEDVTSAAGALVIVCNSDDDADKEARYLTMLAEQQVLGVLVVPIESSAASKALSDRGVPVVLLDQKGRTRRQCSVSVNDRAGGAMAVTHLVAGGRQRLVFVGSGSKLRQAADRLGGARRAMHESGRAEADLATLDTVALNVEGGAAAAATLLAMPPGRRPDALTCVNDLLALGALQALLRAGVKVPDDIAIIGYDDISFAAAAVVPLSSIRQPRGELGRRAAELLIDEATGPEHRHAQVVFEPVLVPRESSS